MEAFCRWSTSVGISFRAFSIVATSFSFFLSLSAASGMSKEQWNKIKSKEKEATKGKNLGKVGITTFKSRSFMDWQKSGGKNLFPVDPTKVKDPKELPYMQRPGGAPDDSDLKKGGGMFGMFNKKKPEAEPEPEKKTNWWTLNK